MVVYKSIVITPHSWWLPAMTKLVMLSYNVDLPFPQKMQDPHIVVTFRSMALELGTDGCSEVLSHAPAPANLQGTSWDHESSARANMTKTPRKTLRWEIPERTVDLWWSLQRIWPKWTPLIIATRTVPRLPMCAFYLVYLIGFWHTCAQRVYFI